MKLIEPYHMLEIMGKTLSYVEPRLMDHGKRVAFLSFKLLKAMNHHNDSDMRNICIAAILHDIGAYKTEEIEKLVVADPGSPWDHSIYGYLFLKYFSPIACMSNAILFHHTPHKTLANQEPDANLREIAQVIHLSDRIDILTQSNATRSDIMSYLERQCGKQFAPELVDTFIQIDIQSLEVDAEYTELMQGLSLPSNEVFDYLRMIIFSIDYRSRHTVNHTMSTMIASEMLANLIGLDDIATEQVKIGAMLHDLGKTSVPTSILESKQRLSPEEMTIMKTHINATYAILEGHVSEEVLRIAVRHHEKLDGSGYILGLSAEELTIPERIVAVADVFSALYGVRSYKQSMPLDEISKILLSMGSGGHLDSQIAQLAVDKRDELAAAIDKVSKPLITIYNDMQVEYTELCNKYKANSR